MRSSFGVRRQARKVGQEEEDEIAHARPGNGDQDHENTPTVTRPPITSRGSSKSKKRSSVRVSFGPGGTSMTEDDDTETAVFTPKKASLSRQAVEKNALRKTIAHNLSSEHLPFRQTEDRPSYGADQLNELKTSTPSAPKNLDLQSDIYDESNKTLDLASKFGSDFAFQDSSSVIPTDAEIREKKQRRARLAKEQDFISLGDDDAQEQEDSDGERSLLPYAQQKASKKEESRLVRDDEDIAEGFDEFVSDGHIALGKKAEREQKKRNEAAMRDLINEAEGGNDSADSEDDSEAERHAAYEAAQTRKGMDGLKRDDKSAKPRRPRTPPRITPLPTLAGCLEKLKQRLAGMEYARMQKVRRLEEIRKEKEDIVIREGEIQELLRETGERYEKLRREAETGGQEDLESGESMAMTARKDADSAKMAWER
ncbi:nineteen complex-related protein 2-domain-containing protein [Usnea florida]